MKRGALCNNSANKKEYLKVFLDKIYYTRCVRKTPPEIGSNCLISTECPASFFHLRFQFSHIPSAIADKKLNFFFIGTPGVDGFDHLLHITTQIKTIGYLFAPINEIGSLVQYKEVFSINGAAIHQRKWFSVIEFN